MAVVYGLAATDQGQTDKQAAWHGTAPHRTARIGIDDIHRQQMCTCASSGGCNTPATYTYVRRHVRQLASVPYGTAAANTHSHTYGTLTDRRALAPQSVPT